MRGDISRGSAMSKFWVSGCSSPMPRAPLAAQRSISVTASCPQAGLTEQKGMRRSLAGSCGAEDIFVGFPGHVQAGPAEPKGDGDVDIRFVHGQEEFGCGGDPSLGIAEEEGESLVLGDYLLSANHEGGWVEVGVEVDYHVAAIIERAVGRKLDSAKGRCYNAPSTRLVMLRGVERRLARFFDSASLRSE